MTRVKIVTTDGVVEGLADEQVRRFFSLPYAAPVTPDRRFREPEPVEKWQGVRDATRPGPCAPQSPLREAEIDLDRLMGVPGPIGPDYLTLNVHAPAEGDRRPVMVFIHGGSFGTVFGLKRKIMILNDRINLFQGYF